MTLSGGPRVVATDPFWSRDPEDPGLSPLLSSSPTDRNGKVGSLLLRSLILELGLGGWGEGVVLCSGGTDFHSQVLMTDAGLAQGHTVECDT